jgi:hypothetical protein
LPRLARVNASINGDKTAAINLRRAIAHELWESGHDITQNLRMADGPL